MVQLGGDGPGGTTSITQVWDQHPLRLSPLTCIPPSIHLHPFTLLVQLFRRNGVLTVLPAGEAAATQCLYSGGTYFASSQSQV